MVRWGVWYAGAYRFRPVHNLIIKQFIIMYDLQTIKKMNRKESERVQKERAAQPKYHHLPLNLQQGIIHTNKPDVSNTICAFYSRHKATLVINTMYYSYDGEAIQRFAEKILGTPLLVKAGDSFGIDTWDKKMYGK